MKKILLIDRDIVTLDLNLSGKGDIFKFLAQNLYDHGRVNNTDMFLKDIYLRESEGVTGLEGGVAIPHARSRYVNYPSLAAARLIKGTTDYESLDGAAIDLIFMIAVPEQSESEYMDILSNLARKLVHADFVESLKCAKTSEEFIANLMIK